MRKRNHVVPVRLNAKELRHLDGQVAKSGLVVVKCFCNTYG